MSGRITFIKEFHHRCKDLEAGKSTARYRINNAREACGLSKLTLEQITFI